jgi:hypothetical protein
MTQPIVQTVRLPSGHTVIFRFEDGVFSKVITPDLALASPAQVMRFLNHYFPERRDFFETVATITGQKITVIDELPDGLEAVSAPIKPAKKQ